MDLPVIEYLRWARGEKRAAYDLSRSGVEPIGLDGLRLSIEELSRREAHEWGSPLFRSAIAASYGLPEENVLPTNGTTFAVCLIAALLLEPGKRVLVEKPAYEPLRRIPRLFGARVDRFPRSFGSGYRLDRDRLADALTPETALVIVTDPHNPTGVRLTIEEREWLAALGEERGVDVLVDEVYIDFDPRGGREEEGYLHAFRHGRRMISAGSLTKVYGLGRLRAGWILARREVIRRAAPLYDYTIGDLSGPTAALGAAALAMRHELRRPAVERSRHNLAIVAAWMKKRPDLEWVRPDCGITAFPRFRKGADASLFLDFALATRGVLAVPGRFFEEPCAFRLGFGIAPPLLEEALDHLGNALAGWH